MKETSFEMKHWLFGEDEPDPEDKPDENGEEGKGDEGKEPENKFSQADVDKMISERLARESAKLKKEAEATAKAEYEKAAKEAEKKAKMDAAEKAKYEQEQLQKQIDELNAYKSRTELSKTVTSLLAEQDIVATDGLQELLIGADEDTTTERVEAFIKEVNAAVERKEKARAKGTTPKSGNAEKGKASDPFKVRAEKYRKKG